MNKGCTLIDFIIVVAILGLIAVVVIPNLSVFKGMWVGNQTSTNQTSVNQTIELIIDGECYRCTKIE